MPKGKRGGSIGTPVTGPSGVVYKSGAECARRYKVSPSLVSYHLNRHGGLHRMKKGSGYNPCPQPTTAKEVKLFGQTFESTAAAARFMGVKDSTLRNRIKRGADHLILRDLMKAEVDNRD